jgi:predicted fused transcriptional regulator/phosphomethylpyrimidine kinase
MANLRYKEKITDSISDAGEIIRSVGRGIEQAKIDPQSAISNLAEAVRKLESAKYYVERE